MSGSTMSAMIVACMKKNPSWSPSQVADHLNTSAAFVRAVQRRARLGTLRPNSGPTLPMLHDRERVVEIIHRLCPPDLAKAVTREIREIQDSAA